MICWHGAPDSKGRLKALSAGYRLRGIGETVGENDYLLIGGSFYPLRGCEVWIGETVEHGSKFELVYTNGGGSSELETSESPLPPQGAQFHPGLRPQ